MALQITDIKNSIRAELASDRLRGADNKELIAKACAQLFWAGITPNQSNVLEVVRIEGSAPSPLTVKKGLETFWASIRKRADLPEVLAEGMPEEVNDAVRKIAPIILDVAEQLGRKWYTDEVAEAQRRAAEAEEKAVRAETCAKDLKAEVNSLADALGKAKESLAAMMDENRSLEDEISGFERAAAVADERMASLERENTELKRQGDLLAGKHERTLADLAFAKEALVRVKSELEVDRKDKEAAEVSHRMALQEARAAADDLFRKLEVSSGDLKQAQSENHTLTGRVETLTGQISYLRRELAAERDKSASLEIQLAVLRSDTDNNRADAWALIKWIRKGAEDPGKAFSAANSPERKVADAVWDTLRVRENKE